MPAAAGRPPFADLGKEAVHKHLDELPDQGEEAAVGRGEQRQGGRGAVGTVAPVSQDRPAHHLQFRIVAAKYVAQRFGQREPCDLPPATAMPVKLQCLSQVVRPVCDGVPQQQRVRNAQSSFRWPSGDGT